MGKKLDTNIIHFGSNPSEHYGSINDPIYKNSTLIFNDYDSYLNSKNEKFKKPYYGRISTYTTRRFEKLVCSLYNSKYAILTSSGLSAITMTLISLLKKNDEILITENCYEPVFNFAKNELLKFGVKSIYYPTSIKKIGDLITKKTKLIYIESPSSINYEVTDLYNLVKIAKKNNILTIMDNTWSTFLGCNPLKFGIDIIIESATKYFSGHSDNFLGLIALSSKSIADKIKKTSVRVGDYVSSESCFVASKGLKTLKIRIEKHENNAEKVFKFLKKSLLINKIIYLPDKNNKYNKTWKKYHSINNGLITFSIKKINDIRQFINKLELFKIGFSWGGYESLIIPLNNIKPSKKMSINSEYWFRIHVGLESYIDLINDLKKALNNYEKK